MVATMPAVAEADIGGKRIVARVDQCKPEEKNTAFCQHVDTCFYGDALVLSVSRDGSVIHRFGYCSAYANAWLRIYGDMRGNPYVFAGYSQGRGPRATGNLVMVFSFGRQQSADHRLTWLATPLESDLFAESLDDSWRPMTAAFTTMAPVDEHQNLTYVYKVEADKNQGLVVDLKAVSCPEPTAETCQRLPRSIRMHVRE